MGILKQIFGPSKDEIWGQIAEEIGGTYIDGGFWQKDVLTYRHEEWTITLDTYTTGNGSSSTTYTRVRAPFVNKDGFYFKVYREGLFSSIGKFFGMQDLQIGDRHFDDHFIIKSNSVHQIKRLLFDEEIKRLFEEIPRVMLEVKDDEGWFGSDFPDGVDELYFQCVGVVRDQHTLKRLFELFSLVLSRLVTIDSAYEDDPQVTLRH